MNATIVPCRVTADPVIAVSMSTHALEWHPSARSCVVSVDAGATWHPTILGLPVPSLRYAIDDAAITARILLNRRAKRALEQQQREERWSRMDTRERIERYVARLDPAQCGRCGKGTSCNSYNRGAFAAVARLLRAFDLDDTSAIRALTPWAQRCDPPLPLRRLVRLIADARKHGRAAA